MSRSIAFISYFQAICCQQFFNLSFVTLRALFNLCQCLIKIIDEEDSTILFTEFVEIIVVLNPIASQAYPNILMDNESSIDKYCYIWDAL